MPFLPPNQQCQSTEGTEGNFYARHRLFHQQPTSRIEIAFRILTLLVKSQEEHPNCKNWKMLKAIVCLSVCLWHSVNDLHKVQLMQLPTQHQQWFTFLVPDYSGCPGKKTIKQVSVSTPSLIMTQQKINYQKWGKAQHFRLLLPYLDDYQTISVKDTVQCPLTYYDPTG